MKIAATPSASFQDKVRGVRAKGKDACYLGNNIKNPSDWILDGGTTQHATNSIDDFISDSITDCNIPVHTGNGTTTVVKKGTVRAFDNFTERVVRLEDVLFLPDCARKLVSQSKLDRAGAMIITHRGVSRILLDGEEVLVAMLRNLYSFDFSLAGDRVNVPKREQVSFNVVSNGPYIPPTRTYHCQHPKCGRRHRHKEGVA